MGRAREGPTSAAPTFEARIREAEIAQAKLGSAILPNGMMLGEYQEKEIRALLGARGRCVWSVLAFWNFHDWTNDPLCVALGVSSFDEIPDDLKERAALFHALFDGDHLRRPRFPLPQIMRVAQ